MGNVRAWKDSSNNNMSVAPKNRKTKGRQLENEIAVSLQILDPEAKRMPLSGAVAGLKGDIITSLPFAIECKFQQNTSFMEWYKQAQEAVTGDKKAMVVWRKNNGEPFVFMKWEDFLSLMGSRE